MIRIGDFAARQLLFASLEQADISDVTTGSAILLYSKWFKLSFLGRSLIQRRLISKARVQPASTIWSRNRSCWSASLPTNIQAWAIFAYSRLSAGSLQSAYFALVSWALAIHSEAVRIMSAQPVGFLGIINRHGQMDRLGPKVVSTSRVMPR